MKFSGNAQSDFPKLPTFLQFCKVASEAQCKKLYIVEKVWLPNVFPSFTFDTEGFRLRINSDSDIGSQLGSALETFETQEACLAIRICSATDGDYEIEVLEGENCIWESLGENGFKLTVKDKKASKSRGKRTT